MMNIENLADSFIELSSHQRFNPIDANSILSERGKTHDK